MSTVSEVLAAVHAGLELLAVSLVTNRCEDQPCCVSLYLIKFHRLQIPVSSLQCTRPLYIYCVEFKVVRRG